MDRILSVLEPIVNKEKEKLVRNHQKRPSRDDMISMLGRSADFGVFINLMYKDLITIMGSLRKDESAYILGYEDALKRIISTVVSVALERKGVEEG